MIKIEGHDVYGWETAIRGMRNPMNSWAKTDSGWRLDDDEILPTTFYRVGDNDLSLMKKLVKAGSDHRKFMRFITVTADITAPLYWWKEFDTYKVGTTANSTSTMHKIHTKEFTLDDFSLEHCLDEPLVMSIFDYTLCMLNEAREKYVATKDKDFWWHIIQLLPTSYNQKRTVLLNYEVLRNMYHARKNHKLDEWVEFCKWIETLPYHELITED